MSLEKIKIDQWAHILRCIAQNGTVSLMKISRMLVFSYPHVCIVTSILEKNGYVSTQFVGREKRVSLTNKGKRFFRSVNIVLNGVERMVYE